jgi:hypothetical protein
MPDDEDKGKGISALILFHHHHQFFGQTAGGIQFHILLTQMSRTFLILSGGVVVAGCWSYTMS